MTHPLTRRALFIGGGRLVAGAAMLSAFRPSPGFAQPLVDTEDLVDAGDGFRRGSGDGAEVGGGPRGPVVKPTRDGASFVSAPLRGSMPFTHVGLHWATVTPGGADPTFELRSGSDGVTWTDWQAVDVERSPEDTRVGDAFGGLIYVGDARYVQYRARFPPARRGAISLQRVTATAIKSKPVGGTSPPPTVTTVTDQDAGRSLEVVRREGWGADETARFSGGPEVWSEMFVPAKKLVVHHTATRNSYADPAAAAAEVRAIYQYHAVQQAWGDIGYNAIIDKYGYLYEGRHGRGGDPGDASTPREILSGGVVAAHDFAHNYGTAGVALLGNATAKDWPMRAASGPMWDALVRYGVFEAGRHFLRPVTAGGAPAASDFLRSDGAWTTGMRTVSGHSETSATACPGTPVMNLLPSLRTAIHAGVSGVSRTGVQLTSTPGGTQVARGTRLTYAWQAEPPEAGWAVAGYEHCWEGWNKPAGSDDIQYLVGYQTDGSGQVVPQPRARWTAVDLNGTTASFTPSQPGHYTVHVRALLSGPGGVTRRGAYEANHTMLVT